MIVRRTGLALPVKPFFLLLLFSSTTQAAGQQRPRPDSVALDSLRRARQDTAQVVADSLRPPAIIVKHARGSQVNLADAVWEWSSDDLLREGAITLTDLLQRIPGVTPFRSGLFLQPEMAGPFGQTRGRIEILLDGYLLDPLTESSYDFARIELAQLRRVRVERRLDVTRIELSSLEATDGRPQSRIEAGVGEPNVNLFRGLLLAPRFLLGPMGLAIERVDTDGYRGREPADDFAGWFKWAWIRGTGGIQFELRQVSLARGPDSPWPGESKRRDVIVRARAPLAAGLVGELFAGQSTFSNDTITVLPDSLLVHTPEADGLQWGARASFDSPTLWTDVSARFRTQQALPTSQIDGQAGLRLSGYGAATASLSYENWRNGGSALSYDLRAQAGPLQGLTAFAEVAGGKRAGPSAYFTDSSAVDLTQRRGLRIGLALERWGITASGAFLRLDTDSTQSFGLPFDSTDTLFSGGNPSGWEFAGSVPLYFRSLTLQGHFTAYPNGQLPIYLPDRLWLIALQFHSSPLKSGNLELLGRIETRHRGQVIAPALATRPGWDLEVLPSYDVIDAYVQIRVIDVRLFLRVENLSNQVMVELPGRLIQTPRYMYGVKWNFWN